MQMAMKISLGINKELIRAEDQIEIGAKGSVHKEGSLVGKDSVEIEIIIKGKGVKDILEHFPKKRAGFDFTGSHLRNRKIDLVIE